MLASQQVVQAIAQRLTGLATGAQVFTDRAWPLTLGALPAWNVFADDEEIKALTVSQDPTQEHRLSVECRGYVTANSELDEAMAALAEEALAAVANLSPAAPDALSTLRPRVTVRPAYIRREMQSEGQAHVGRVTLLFPATFRTRMSAPSLIV